MFIAPEKGDSAFKWSGFGNAINKDLADTLGNFVNRVCSFILRYFHNIIPIQTKLEDADREIISRLKLRILESQDNLEKCQFQKAIRAQRALWADCNWYFEFKKTMDATKDRYKCS